MFYINFVFPCVAKGDALCTQKHVFFLTLQVLEISHLSKLPNLEQLMIRGNPFTQSPSYRMQVFNILLEKAKQVNQRLLFSVPCLQKVKFVV